MLMEQSQFGVGLGDCGMAGTFSTEFGSAIAKFVSVLVQQQEGFDGGGDLLRNRRQRRHGGGVVGIIATTVQQVLIVKAVQFVIKCVEPRGSDRSSSSSACGVVLAVTLRWIGRCRCGWAVGWIAGGTATGGKALDVVRLHHCQNIANVVPFVFSS